MDAPAISAASLRQSLASARPPLVIDVRKVPAFLCAADLIRGALRRDPARVAEWGNTLPREADVVVYCVHGHEVSQAAAKAAGARYLEGGIEAWRAAGGELFGKPKDASSRWVTRERPKVEFTHDGDLCSFDAFIKNFRLKDQALDQLAVIVRGADTGRPDLAPQSAGLLAVSLGLSLNIADDHRMLEQGMVVYDALYAWCKRGKNETHTWNPDLYR